ncbi:pyridine nucleotide-disulfide oxidoreductase-domain-containing protein [Dimargaris cristalligena]|uniref:NADH:ubiquinone reductase (non-electrogenic) n=1 Tax=Dimargaris cristalligena TaxID=215637 RepID=A0A4P9ZTM8_9FUNG|nr:pyridine nucleotide-disulfide oxidoreductase-domain-containing protein [Dimargaris cristalligena]|eukprot:RKP36837.1 pyridine nucleotide-disulfide oxidoreductase-domain-containing protein [Dimargaris cristalligena]
MYATAAGSVTYAATKVYYNRHPMVQSPPDPSKKTLLILGTGWGAASILKGIDTSLYNVVVVSPRNYFLFTPLLPSCTVGTIEHRSIMEPIRYITRHKQCAVKFHEANCTDIDPVNKTVTVEDQSEIKGKVNKSTLKYDYLVVAVGAENNTFGIKGVTEHACFLKEIWDARKIRTRLMDCIESAAFPGQPEEEVKRLLHMVVVGGGPTGVEYAGELHDFLVEDLVDWYPDLADKVQLSLVEGQSSVLPMFSRKLIDYTESTFKSNQINILTGSAVKEVHEKHIVIETSDKQRKEIPFGLLVWATGNTQRSVVRDLMGKLPEAQTSRRGLLVDDHLRVQGTNGMWALGDATFTKYAPLAQVASQQGTYLAKLLNRLGKLEDTTTTAATTTPDELIEKLRPFRYSYQGSLAYIGADRAIADIPIFGQTVASSGVATYLFWKSAYVNLLFNTRNQSMVTTDWVKKTLFGRDISRE